MRQFDDFCAQLAAVKPNEQRQMTSNLIAFFVTKNRSSVLDYSAFGLYQPMASDYQFLPWNVQSKAQGVQPNAHFHLH
jgi:hypothetical protein